jgi:hypothetical protein
VTFEWLGSLVATVAVTALVTNIVAVRKSNSGNGASRVMLDKLDRVCENMKSLDTLTGSMERVVQLLGEIKGLLSVRR